MTRPDPHDAGTRLTLQAGLASAKMDALSVLLSELLAPPKPISPPIAAAALLLGDASMAAALEGVQAPDGTFALQESQSFVGCDVAALAGPITMTLRSDVSPNSARYSFGAEHLNAQIETRVRFQTPDQIRALKAPGFHARMLTDAATTLKTVPFTHEHLQRYATLANDANPIHVDVHAARTAGFSHTVVPGMLLCGLAETACRSAHPTEEISELRARFLSPALEGAAVTLMVGRFAGQVTQKARVFVIGANQDIHAIVDVMAT